MDVGLPIRDHCSSSEATAGLGPASDVQTDQNEAAFVRKIEIIVEMKVNILLQVKWI